jgi:hydroxymethylpyrimidine/phosphomethylpyrimidine kinase
MTIDKKEKQISIRGFKNTLNLLSIGGSDPSSGAGIQSDLKTFTSLNAYGLTIITAITSQNTSNFGMIETVSEKILKNQLDSIISDFKIDGIKIGMVYNSKIIKLISKELENIHVPLVLDPIIKSTTGGMLMESSAINDFKKFLIPITTVITPNKFEAEYLTEIKIDSKKSLHEAAQSIQHMGAKNTVITGLEIKKNQVSDFVLEEKNQYMLSSKKFLNINHGSGCNYSSSLLFALTSRMQLKEALQFSKDFTYNSIKNAKYLGKGISITQIKNNDEIFQELSQAINAFVELKDIYKHIPECQTNFVFAKNHPRSIKDVLGISGRIVKSGTDVIMAGNLLFGGSRHVASALISINQKYPEIKSAINLKYDEDVISKLEKTRLTISSYDRSGEPEFIKNSEGASIEWGIKSAIKNLKSSPDVIYHKGDLGKEPMIIVFAKSPRSIIQKIIKFFL